MNQRLRQPSTSVDGKTPAAAAAGDLLDIRGLTVRFATRHGAFTAVDGK